jgi:ATP-binding cassette, subfamily A (ABC1), member 3
LDKEDEQRCSRESVEQFIKEHVEKVELERETASELVYGVKRGQSKQVEDLIERLEQEKGRIGIKSYGLSMTTIEDVFLR